MADFSDFTAEQTAADDAQYRAMADELSQPDPDIPEAFGDAIEPGDIPSSREPGPQPAEQQQGSELSNEEWEAQTAAELDELWAMRAEQLQHQVPALEEDPIGHFQAKLGQIEAAHQQQQQAEFWNTVIQSENEARQELPDYDKATTFLEESRVAELKALYPDRNPHALAMARQNGFQSIQQFRDYILNQDRVTVAATALQRGVSPAKFYYELAQQRGWQGRGASRSSRGSRGSSRGSTRGAGMDVAKLADLAVDDPAAFDEAWDKWAASQR